MVILFILTICCGDCMWLFCSYYLFVAVVVCGYIVDTTFVVIVCSYFVIILSICCGGCMWLFCSY